MFNFNQFFVLICGRPAKDNEFPSLSTVRSNITQLDKFDEYNLKQNIDTFTQTLSPRGNRVYFGGSGNGTCLRKADKREIGIIAVAILKQELYTGKSIHDQPVCDRDHSG